MYDLKKGLKYSYDYAMKHKLIVLLALLILFIIIMSMRRSEGFRFPMPDLALELECKPFGYFCCSSSYTTNPFLVYRCSYGDGMKMFYKWTNELGEVITSGLYDYYVQHYPGSYIRFSDNKLYKLLSTNPDMKPANCKIVNEKGHEDDSAIPGTLYSA